MQQRERQRADQLAAPAAVEPLAHAGGARRFDQLDERRADQVTDGAPGQFDGLGVGPADDAVRVDGHDAFWQVVE